MVNFEVDGPYDVPVYRGNASRIIREEEGDLFFSDNEEIAERVGCCVFGMRAGGGIIPYYVGKATKGFAKECFTPHKIAKYNTCLSDYRRGAPVMFFVVHPIRRGCANCTHIADLERFRSRLR